MFGNIIIKIGDWKREVSEIVAIVEVVVMVIVIVIVIIEVTLMLEAALVDIVINRWLKANGSRILYVTTRKIQCSLVI